MFASQDEEEDFATTHDYLRTAFQDLESRDLPNFDWQKTEKVMCMPAFTPDRPYGPVTTMPANSEPIDYFQRFYDDELLEKVSYYYCYKKSLFYYHFLL